MKCTQVASTLAGVLLCSCGPREEVGPELTEPAEVIHIEYQAGSSQSVSTTWEDTFFGSGDIPHESHKITKPEKFVVGFKCQHGKFLIEDEGKGSRAESLWKTLEKGDKVTVQYCEVFEVAGNQRRFMKYRFLDATKVAK